MTTNISATGAAGVAGRARGRRRSFLMAPADNADLLRKQASSGADACIICIEDAVLPERKAEGRRIAAEALNSHAYGDKERFIRINGPDTEFWLDDLEYFTKHSPPTGFIITKVKTPEDVRVVARVLQTLEIRNNLPVGGILLSAYIETAEAMRNVYEIAAAHPRMANLHFGAEDYTHSIGATRTPQQLETLYAMSRVVSAARASGLEPINVMHIVVHDMEGLRASSEYSKQLGFTGRTCPTPRHIPVLHEVFSPSAEEVAYAKEVVAGYRDAQKRGAGVYMVGDGMIDGPMIWKAMRVLDRADVAY
ncbi:HpcH/HpaI aldolase/citrate lyase family protein [Ramlibacter sp.]|uniref:HpcH/HpaI aldolase/citrate lyase family protein n=1 Tax=Ramlibacter sp. TaxID=1917967 RepID=UPI003D11B57A